MSPHFKEGSLSPVDSLCSGHEHSSGSREEGASESHGSVEGGHDAREGRPMSRVTQAEAVSRRQKLCHAGRSRVTQTEAVSRQGTGGCLWEWEWQNKGRALRVQTMETSLNVCELLFVCLFFFPQMAAKLFGHNYLLSCLDLTT